MSELNSIQSHPDAGNRPDDSMAVYLFHQGSNYKCYEYFGCHKAEGGHVFRTWAPNARAVYITGEFCGWDPRRWPMEKISDGGIWEVTIPGLNQYDLYKIVVESPDGELLYHADPYASHDETRPGTASKVYDLPDYQWGDAAWMEERRKADIVNRPMNIYEMHAGSWKKRGERRNAGL